MHPFRPGNRILRRNKSLRHNLPYAHRWQSESQCHTEIVDNQGCRPGLGDSVTTGHGAAFINQKADSNVTLFMGKGGFS